MTIVTLCCDVTGSRGDKTAEEEAPARLLDELFRKTKTTPCIYWLPLTAEQVCVSDVTLKEAFRCDVITIFY